MEKQKPYIAAIVIQCSYAGMLLLSKAAISSGMKPSVFVAYRQAFASATLLPLAFFFRSKDCPPLTWTGCFKIFFVSSYGLALSPNLNFSGFKYISATIGAAGFTIVLPLVFIISVCLRVEKVGIRERHGVAEIVGCMVCVSGAMAFTFYKGPPLFSNNSRNLDHAHHLLDEMTPTKQQWIKGSLLTIASSLCCAFWLTQQAQLLQQNPDKLKLTALQNGFSCLAALAYAAATERHRSSWKLGFGIELLSVTYAGIIVIGMIYWLQAWVVEKKGPIFNAIFGPLTLIIAAFISAIFLEETFHWGSFLGCGLVVVGLYIFLWGSNGKPKL